MGELNAIRHLGSYHSAFDMVALTLPGKGWTLIPSVVRFSAVSEACDRCTNARMACVLVAGTPVKHLP